MNETENLPYYVVGDKFAFHDSKIAVSDREIQFWEKLDDMRRDAYSPILEDDGIWEQEESRHTNKNVPSCCKEDFHYPTQFSWFNIKSAKEEEEEKRQLEAFVADVITTALVEYFDETRSKSIKSHQHGEEIVDAGLEKHIFNNNLVGETKGRGNADFQSDQYNSVSEYNMMGTFTKECNQSTNLIPKEINSADACYSGEESLNEIGNGRDIFEGWIFNRKNIRADGLRWIYRGIDSLIHPIGDQQPTWIARAMKDQMEQKKDIKEIAKLEKEISQKNKFIKEYEKKMGIKIQINNQKKSKYSRFVGYLFYCFLPDQQKRIKLSKTK